MWYYYKILQRNRSDIIPRQARIKGEFSVYHVIQRGNERKDLFLSVADRVKFLDILLRMKAKYNFLIYSFCLMSNHIHLLIDDNGNDISKLVKSINISYAYYFNRTYERCGHLFQDRFRSERIDSDAYLIEVSKYIHNNPVKAGLVKESWEYRWSSCDVYTGRRKSTDNLISAARILSLFSVNPSVAAKEYETYVTGIDSENVRIMDEEERTEDKIYNSGFVNTLEQAKNKVLEAVHRESLSFDEAMKDKSIRNRLMKQIRMNSSLSLKQIGELFGGVSESRVSRILGKR